MLKSTSSYRFILLLLACAFLRPGGAIANEDGCQPGALSISGVIAHGGSANGYTPRCIRRVAEGVRASCDSGEKIVSFFCEHNGSPSGGFSALVSAGVIGYRTAACLWSNVTDATILIRCKAVGKGHLKGDAVGDVYFKYSLGGRSQ